MYNQNGTFYNEEHSISFGEIIYTYENGSSYQQFYPIANTWEDWHLIPSSRPAVANPTIVTKYVEIPGSDGMLDLTNYLAGRPIYGQRQGSFSFRVDNDHEHWENLRKKIANAIHGRDVCMILEDDPTYFYKGRITVGNWESGGDCSSISLAYQLEPFKYKINMEGSVPVIWDTFNFETDYDYYTSIGDSITVDLHTNPVKTIPIYISDYTVTPIVSLISTGDVEIDFNGETWNITREAGTKVQTVEFSPAIHSFSLTENNYKTMTISGSGTVQIKWRGGSL